YQTRLHVALEALATLHLFSCPRDLPSFPTRRSSDLPDRFYRYIQNFGFGRRLGVDFPGEIAGTVLSPSRSGQTLQWANTGFGQRSEEHTSELQSREKLVCRLLLEKKKFLADAYKMQS